MISNLKIVLNDGIQRSELSSKTARIQIWLFILPCFIFTGIFTYLAVKINPDMTDATSSYFTMLACLMPAVIAIVICWIMKIEIRELAIFPRLRGNVGIYLTALLSAVLLSLLEEPLMALVFPDIVQFRDFNFFVFSMNTLTAISISLVGIITLLGEEIGWLGFLFPRLEKLYGTIPAVVFMGLIRGVWHLVMLLAAGSDTVWIQFGMITFNNVVMDSLFICLMKKTSSIIPAALFHSVTNTLPVVYNAFIIMNEPLYEKNYFAIQMVSMIPVIVIGIACYTLLVLWCRTYSNERNLQQDR